jgi:HEAT repeat protein
MNNKLKKLHDSRGMGMVILLLISFLISSIGCTQQGINSPGEIGTLSVQQLIAALKDGNSNVRTEAAMALGQIGAPALEPLIAALKDGNSNVRSGAAKALGLIMDVRAVEPLIASLKDEDSSVRELVAVALRKIGSPAVQPLIEALKNEDTNLRKGAANTLGRIKDARAVESLITVLKDENLDVREEAASALGQIGAPADEPLLTALKNNDFEVIFAAHHFFISRGEKDSEAVLIKVLNEYGTEDLAEDFLNCGNSLLANAGREWAKARGYSIKPGEGEVGSVWGNSQ